MGPNLPRQHAELPFEGQAEPAEALIPHSRGDLSYEEIPFGEQRPGSAEALLARVS